MSHLYYKKYLNFKNFSLHSYHNWLSVPVSLDILGWNLLQFFKSVSEKQTLGQVWGCPFSFYFWMKSPPLFRMCLAGANARRSLHFYWCSFQSTFSGFAIDPPASLLHTERDFFSFVRTKTSPTNRLQSAALCNSEFAQGTPSSGLISRRTCPTIG